MMSWEDHVVECKNKNGETKRFLLASNAPAQNVYYKYIGIPYSGSKLDSYKASYEVIVWEEFGKDNWRFNSQSVLEKKGWDLRPLEMHEDKPYPEAVLAYHPKSDEYAWFLHNRYAPYKDASYKAPWRSNNKYNINHIWCLTKSVKDCKDKWETQLFWETHENFGGWVFPDGAFETKTEEEVMPKTDELIKKVIRYCEEKSSRIPYLEGMILAGYLNPNDSYEVVADYITNYINGTNACDDGKKRALKALGLGQKLVVKQMETKEIQAAIRNGHTIHFVDKDGCKLTTTGTTPIYTLDYLSPVHFEAMHVVGVYE